MLEKRTVNELLKKVRLDAGYKQKEACVNLMDTASYSRIEAGKRNIDFEQIIKVLGNLSVSLEEFVEVYVRPEIQESVRVYFARLVNSLPSAEALDKILKLYKGLSLAYPDLSYDELGVYFDIKTFFHSKIPDKIPAITDQELNDIFAKFQRTRKKRFFVEDVRLIAHTIMNFDKERMLILINMIFPIDGRILVTDQSKKYLSLMFLNSISPLLKEKEYEAVGEILTIVKEHKFIYMDSYYYRLSLGYLENMYLLLITNDPKKMEEVSDFIKFFEMVGDVEEADLIRKEVKELLSGKGNEGNSEHDIILAKL